MDELTKEEEDALTAAGYVFTGSDGYPDGTIFLFFEKDGEEVQATPAEWRSTIAGLNKPPTEDEAAFGKGAWVYCSQHMRPHQTGWCTVSPRDKVGLGVGSAEAAYEKCRAWKFELYQG